MTVAAAAGRFERLYHESPDPWGYLTSDYEREKYTATLAALPKRSHGLCLEVGCSIGVFTGLLAACCEHVVAIDFSLGALQLARRRLQGARNVDLLRASFPEEAPPGSWDLIWRGSGREEPLLGDEVHDRLARELAGWHTLDARQDGYRLDRFDGR
jgi:SAM-dependent methyltransferase